MRKVLLAGGSLVAVASVIAVAAASPVVSVPPTWQLFAAAGPGNATAPAQEAAENADAEAARLAAANCTGTAPVLPPFDLALHPMVEQSILAARQADFDARQEAEGGRAAQAQAREAAERAREAAANARRSQPNYAVQRVGNGSYEGAVLDTVPHGAGVFTSADGERYEGDWTQNLRNGFGVSMTSSKITFEGTWKNGDSCGVGVVTYPNGDRYEGEYCKGNMHGRGVFVFAPRADNYVGEDAGEWTMNAQTGMGVRLWTTGARSEGQWREGKLDGYGANFGLCGTVATVLGVPQQGIFANGMLQRPLSQTPQQAVAGESLAPDPPPFVRPAPPAPIAVPETKQWWWLPLAELPLNPDVRTALTAARAAEQQARAKATDARAARDMARAAAGRAQTAAATALAKGRDHAVQTFANLGTYQGHIAERARSGAGVFVAADGERYEGEWSMDLRNGYGVSKPRSGISFEGAWKDGVPCGVGVVSWPDGSRYEGEYCRGQYTGYGVYYSVASSPDKESAGQWRESKFTGLGVRVFRDETRWDGNWRDGRLNGAGAKLLADSLQQGIFADDVLRTPLTP
jgi:hypothetical protein